MHPNKNFIFSLFQSSEIPVIQATASSTYGDLPNTGPDRATDGIIVRYWDGMYISKLEQYPWLQFQLPPRTEVSKIVCISRLETGSGQHFRQVIFHVGDQVGKSEQLNPNPICATYTGPFPDTAQHEITCGEPLIGQFLTLQLAHEDYSHLQVNEVKVFGPASPGNTKSIVLLK